MSAGTRPHASRLRCEPAYDALRRCAGGWRPARRPRHRQLCPRPGAMPKAPCTTSHPTSCTAQVRGRRLAGRRRHQHTHCTTLDVSARGARRATPARMGRRGEGRATAAARMCGAVAERVRITSCGAVMLRRGQPCDLCQQRATRRQACQPHAGSAPQHMRQRHGHTCRSLQQQPRCRRKGRRRNITRMHRRRARGGGQSRPARRPPATTHTHTHAHTQPHRQQAGAARNTCVAAQPHHLAAGARQWRCHVAGVTESWGARLVSATGYLIGRVAQRPGINAESCRLLACVIARTRAPVCRAPPPLLLGHNSEPRNRMPRPPPATDQGRRRWQHRQGEVGSAATQHAACNWCVCV